MIMGGDFRGACFSSTPHSSPDWRVFFIFADSDNLINISWKYGQDKYEVEMVRSANLGFLPAYCSPVYMNGRLYCLDAEGLGRVGVYHPNDSMWLFLQSSARPLAQGFRRHWRASLVDSNGKLLAAFYDPDNPSSLALFKLQEVKWKSSISFEASWKPVRSLDAHQSLFLNFSSSLLVKGPRTKEDTVEAKFPGNQAFFSMVVGDSTPVPGRLTCTERGMFFTQSSSEAVRQSSLPRCHRKADPLVSSIGSANVNQLLSGNNHKDLPNSVWIVPAIDLSNANNDGNIFSMPNAHMWEPDCVAREEDNVGQILNQLHLADSTTGNQTLSRHLSPWVLYHHNEKKTGKGQKLRFPTITYVSAVDGRCYDTAAFKEGGCGEIWRKINYLAMTPQGWMVFQRLKKPGKLLLLNPISDDHVPLPPLPYKEIFYFDLAIPPSSPQGSNNLRININVAACKDTKELLRYELGNNTVERQWQRHHHGQDMVVGLATCSVSGRRVYIFNHEGRLDCMDLDH